MKTLAMAVLAALWLTGCAGGPIIGSTAVPSGSRYVHANTVTYALPRVRSELQLKKTSGDKFHLYYVSEVVSPDPQHIYTLDYGASVFADDQVTVSTTAEGLLDKLDVTNEDKTGAFLIELADLAKQAAKAAEAFGIQRTVAEEKERLVADLAVDLTDPAEVASLNQFLEQHDSTKKTRVSVKVDAPNTVALADDTRATSECAASVCFRPVLPYVVTIDSGDGAREQRIVLSPNRAPIARLDISRASFVKKVTNVVFDKGRITSVKIVKPSEAVGLATIPVEILKVILSIPAELVQLKIDTTNKNKELATAQQQLIEAQKQLIDARKKAITGEERFDAK